jgi:hypothetical protein
MAAKKIKLKEEAICEILVADTDSESGAEASNVEDEFEEEEVRRRRRRWWRRRRRRRRRRQRQQQQQASAEA